MSSSGCLAGRTGSNWHCAWVVGRGSVQKALNCGRCILLEACGKKMLLVLLTLAVLLTLVPFKRLEESRGERINKETICSL